MKIFFTVVLVLNFLIEVGAGVSLITGAGTMFTPEQAQGAMWSRNYAFGAFAWASTVIWIWPHRDNLKVVTVALGMLLTFQVSILFALASSGQTAGAIIHSVMTVLCLILFFLRKKWCTE